MPSLEARVREMRNLQDAWAKVRSNIRSSDNKDFQNYVRDVDQNRVGFLRKIQTQLREGSFEFTPQIGYLKKKKGTKGRPIVISPVSNRLIQRAILNILQKDPKETTLPLGKIPEIIRVPTSIGGTPQRGVKYGLSYALSEISQGHPYFFKSDIKEFFMRIPKNQVLEFVLEQTDEEGFSILLERALATELENEDEVKESLHLFPIGDVGVPQGSALSVFAGNIVLKEFDKRMNGRGIVTLRYIDDFLILGKSETSVKKAFESAQQILSDMGMAAYRPEEDASKANQGKIEQGFDFLGCSVRGGAVFPTKKSEENIIRKVRYSLNDGRTRIQKLITDAKPRRAQETYVQTLARIDNQLRGWGDAFDFCNDRLCFERLDTTVDKMLSEFRGWTETRIKKCNPVEKRRVLGVTSLQDIPFKRLDVKR